MKITNKFDMLDAMSDISEEYIRKADRLLAQHHTGEAAVKMEITPMKFSWVSVAAVAACLVILVGMTFGIKAFMNKPVDFLTPAQQAYLNEWKDKLGGSVNVAYAVDRLNFIELEIPDDVVPVKFIDENRVVFIRDEKRGDELVKTIEIYNFADKSYSVIAGGSGKINLIKQLDICYADNDYVIHHGESYQVTGVFIPSAQLSLYNVKTGEDTVIYTSEYGSINWQIPMTVLDGKVYFTVFDQFDERSIHVYDIGQRKEIDVIANAGSPQKYKGDILYLTEENGRTVTRSLSGKYSFDGGVWATEYGLYQYNYTGEERLKDLESGKVIIPGDTKGIVNLDDSCDFAMQFGGVRINSTAAAENALGFLFYAPTNEALVFQNGDGFSGFSCFGWGATISKREPDGTVRTFIVTDKESENAVKIPKLDYSDEWQKYLDKWKEKLGSSIDVAYAVDRLNFAEIELPGEAADGAYFTDENTAVYITERGGKQYFVLYNMRTKTDAAAVELSGSAERDRLIFERDWLIDYVDHDYVLYYGYDHISSQVWDSAPLHENDKLYLYDIKSKKSTLIYSEETIYHDILRSGSIIADGKVYFTVSENNDEISSANTLHIYDIKSQNELEPVPNASFPKYCNGEIFYSDPADDYRVKSLGGKYDFVSSAIVSKFGVFYISTNVGLKDLETDNYKFYAHIEQDHLNGYDICDFALMFNGLRDITVTENPNYLYYAPTNEILVFQGGDGFEAPTFFGWGGYISKIEKNGTVKKYLFTDKKIENAVKIPKLVPQSGEGTVRSYLDEFRENYNVNESVNAAYARDRLNITRFSLPWDISMAVDSGTLFIDSNHALVSDIILRNKIEMYTLDTGEYTTLLSAENDPLANENTLYRIYYADSEYIVFQRTDFNGQSDICLIELKKNGYPCTTIYKGGSAFRDAVFIDDNTVYFAVRNGDKPAVYQYDIRLDEEAVSYISEGVPLCVYNDELLYYTMEEGEPYFKGVQTDETDYNKRIIRSAYGKLAIEGQPYTENMWACKYGVFKTEGGELKNCLTGSVIFSSDHDPVWFESLQTDFGMVFGHGFVQYIYNANTNEILVFDSKDDITSYSWRSCGWGVCSSDGILISQYETARPMNDRDLSYSDHGIPEVYIPTNSRKDYPFNIRLDIDTDTISFEKYDEPLYGAEEYLDEDKLGFTMNIALKENFYKYDTAELEIEGHGTVILKRGETLQIPMTMNDQGQFGITLLTDTMELGYGSTYHSVAELSNTIVVEIFYMKAYEGGRRLRQ